MRLRLGYPSEGEEEEIIERFEAADPLASTEPVLEAKDILQLWPAMTARLRSLEPLAIVTNALWYFAVSSVLVALLKDEPGPSFWALLAAAGWR